MALGFTGEKMPHAKHNNVNYHFIPKYNSLLNTFEPPRGKTKNVVSEQVRHKPTCKVTEKTKKLEISDLSRRGIVLSV